MRWIRVLPLRSLSRLASRLQHVVIPTYLRTPLFGSFRMMYRMDPETIDRPLAEYRTPNEFFARSIPNGVRPIAPSPMVSPVDGRIQDLGELSDDHDTVWKIKGLSHSIMSFLGEPPHQRKHGSRYYYMIVYLTPGDYHRFHSPSDWTIHHRRHFPGNTHPVNPWYSIFVPGVLSLNERIVLAGTWKGGHTYLGAVGAMFVNSIQLDIEQELRTNVPSQDDMARMGGRSFLHHYDGRGIVSSKGSPLGKFNLGSTIVLVFECTGFQWTVSTGERVKMGQPLGEVA